MTTAPGRAAPFPVVIEARHVRLTAAHVELLFGKGHGLTSLIPLEHTERWAAIDVVEVRGPAGAFKNVRVLGPTVDATRVFVSDDDLDVLGFDVDASATCTLEGPRGTIVLASGGVHLVRRLVVTQELAAAHELAAGKGVDVIVHGERARELRGVRVEIGAALFLGVDITDANAMDVGPTTRASLS